MAEGPGDILVFLPGERDIRDAAETLTGRRLPNTEIIPLLASLPAGEQQRAFRLSSNRRIILSTNVAETSVTLPGIRYVIDSGLARLSRYNARTQVQRLQIEPISQASANQRQGRCGRLAPGICIRLYDEDDFRKRDPFTPRESVRSSLSGVFLTMLDLALGDIESFPFIDPPSPAMIRDGYRQLDLLGALESPPSPPADAEVSDSVPPTLSALGRRLARLPLDPALARILFAAHHEKVLADALIVVAAMECDDPRRRPIEKQTEADKLHARFLTPLSDFAATLRLWRWYHEQTAGASQSRARRLCKDNFLSYPRMRDWIDLRGQLERLCTELQLDVTSASGGDNGLHRALLTGLLGNLGKRDPEIGDYRGARGIRFSIFPGSGLAKLKEAKPALPDRTKPSTASRRPNVLSRDWILAGELVETSRLFARTAACIDPSWIEPIAKRFCKSSYHSPSWDERRGFVRVRERVTLFGLVLVEGRTRDYSRIEPAEARAIFIREGLIAGAFRRCRPLRTISRVSVPCSTPKKDAPARCAFWIQKPPLLSTTPACRRNCAVPLTSPLAARTCGCGQHADHDRSDLPPVRDLSQMYPDAVTLSGNRLALTYRNAPGETDDGITCTVPAAILPLVAAWRSEWLVPGLLDEKLRWMIHVLPTRYRRLLQPIDETLSMCRSYLQPGQGSLNEAFSDALYTARNIRVPTDYWNEDAVPDHLRMRFVVQDETGRELGSGRNIALLVKLFAPRNEGASATVRTPDLRWQKDGLTQWDFGALPAQIDAGKAGWSLIHYPALVNAGDTASLRLFATSAEAAAAHDKGVCRLIAIALGKEWKRVTQPPSLPFDVAAYLKQLDMSAESLGKELGVPRCARRSPRAVHRSATPRPFRSVSPPNAGVCMAYISRARG